MAAATQFAEDVTKDGQLPVPMLGPLGPQRNRAMVDIGLVLRDLGHDVMCFGVALISAECRGTYGCLRAMRKAGLPTEHVVLELHNGVYRCYDHVQTP
jgi:hypothetical protein